MKDEDYPRALRAVDLLLRVDPGSAEDLRDRGILYAALDCYDLALRDLEAYLALAPQPRGRRGSRARIARPPPEGRPPQLNHGDRRPS